MICGGGAFGTLMNEISVLRRRGQSLLALPLPCEDAQGDSASQKRALPRTCPCRHPGLGLPAPELGEISLSDGQATQFMAFR